jgi:pyruvate/2-oxoglutarate dehydrogenase complex dihydrolipoamide dehydrogenase (E3) component
MSNISPIRWSRPAAIGNVLICCSKTPSGDVEIDLDLDRLPGTMAVVGAGVIGSEYASTFAALGASIHLIDGHNALLPFLDAELSRALTAVMEKNGIRFHWGDRPRSYRQEESGKVTVTLESGDQLSVDAVLVASGRKSNTETLNLAAAGVTVGDRGIIPVDASYRTNVPHIFAAGDVIGFPALASTSMQQARYAIRAAFIWTTHVRIAALVEAQFAIHVARQTDAYTFADGARFPPARREPERTGGAQIQTILPEINLHGLG